MNEEFRCGDADCPVCPIVEEPTIAQRVAALEEENKVLRDQLDNTRAGYQKLVMQSVMFMANAAKASRELEDRAHRLEREVHNKDAKISGLKSVISSLTGAIEELND